MNERIEYLAELCTTVYDTTTIPVEKDFDYKKFAELIVKECVKEIEFQYGGGSDELIENEWDHAIECVSAMIRHHFGVV